MCLSTRVDLRTSTPTSTQDSMDVGEGEFRPGVVSCFEVQSDTSVSLRPGPDWLREVWRWEFKTFKVDGLDFETEDTLFRGIYGYGRHLRLRSFRNRSHSFLNSFFYHPKSGLGPKPSSHVSDTGRTSFFRRYTLSSRCSRVLLLNPTVLSLLFLFLCFGRGLPEPLYKWVCKLSLNGLILDPWVIYGFVCYSSDCLRPVQHVRTLGS